MLATYGLQTENPKAIMVYLYLLSSKKYCGKTTDEVVITSNEDQQSATRPETDNEYYYRSKN
jgi:hypothetical protein